jgi:hypothetical protein
MWILRDYMTNPDHRCTIERYVPEWNSWRRSNPNNLPELSEAKVIDPAEKKAKEQTGR